MRHIKILAVIAGVLTCASSIRRSAQAGDVYKYVDERGTTLYTDKPIPGAVLVSTGAQRPPEVAQRNYAAQQAATNSQLNASNQRIADSQDIRASPRTSPKISKPRAPNVARRRATDYETVHQLAAPVSRPQGRQARIPERCRTRAAARRCRARRSKPSAARRAEVSVSMLDERRPLDGVFLCGARA